jgi:hypothetical protein
MSDEITINDINTPINIIEVDDILIQQDVNITSEGSPVVSVNSRIGAVVLNSSDVGLNQVNNTSDLDKPVSTATLSALNIIQSEIDVIIPELDSVYSNVNTLSGNWDDAYTYVTSKSGIDQNQQEVNSFVNSNSANIVNVNTLINSTSGNWNNVYNTVQTNSALNWNYQGTDIKALTGNWEGGNIAYTNLISNSAAYLSAVDLSLVNSTSGNWNIAYTNLISNSAAYLSAVDLSFLSVSGNWDSTYSTVQNNSATTWNYQGSDLKALSGNWEGGNIAYTNLTANSAAYLSAVDLTLINSTSGNWNDAYSYFNTNSAFDLDSRTFVNLNSANIVNVNTKVNTTSANWDNAYNVATIYQNNSSSFATNTLLESTSALLTPLTLTNNLTSQLVKTTDLNSLSATLLTRTDYSLFSATLLPTSVYQNTSGSFATNTLLESTSALLTPLTLTNNLTSLLVTKDNFNNYQTNVANTTAILLPTSTYQNTSGSFVQNTAINSLTGDWNKAYNNSTVYANNSASYASLNYVDSNFFNLTGGIISGATRINNNLTVFGNLTATGTTTFANTIFSVTSSLSVVHIGSGPALYVGNNGDGDIASFYDLDQGIEILHVGGNNGSFPNVGVKTSSPNVDFTVNGQISANNTIWSSGGNSNNWNSTFTTLCANSSTWVKFQPLVYNADNASDVYVNGQRFYVATPGSYYTNNAPYPSRYLLREVGDRWYYREENPGDDGYVNIDESTNDASYPWLATWVGTSVFKAPTQDRIIPKPLSAISFNNTFYFEGSSIYAAKADHSHAYPTPVQIGAAPTVHNHTISQITNLQTTLNTISAAANNDIWTLTNTQENIFGGIIIYNNSIKPVIGNNNVIDSLYSIINAGQNNNIWNNHYKVPDCANEYSPSGIVENSIIAGGNNNSIKADSYDASFYDGSDLNGAGYYANIYNASILGGQYNIILAVNPYTVPFSLFTSNYNTIVGGVSGLIYNGDYNFIGGGFNNKIYNNYNNIIGGQNNSLSGTNNFILGSNISVSANNYTFVNNLSSLGSVYGTFYGDGSNLTGISGGGGSSAYSIVSANFSALVNKKYLVDTTSSSVVGTLPSSPTLGDNISFVDSSNTWGANPLILNNNGNLLQTYNEALTANISGYQFQLVYVGGSYGWKIV